MNHVCKEDRYVLGRQVVKRFERMNKSTELDTLVNRQPVELLKKRGIVSAPLQSEWIPSCGC